MPLLVLVVALLLGQQPSAPPPTAPSPAASSLDYEFFKTRVQLIFLAKRPGHARCITCHESGQPRLAALPDGAAMWNEEQSRQNFAAWRRVVVAGNPDVSRLAMHPLAKAAGGDPFHAGGKHWQSRNDPEFQTLAAWIRGEKAAPAAGATALAAGSAAAQTRAARIIQTNAAGNNVHVIDPATNKVVGVIEDIEVPHGVSAAPDGRMVFITNESLHTVDAVSPQTWQVVKRIPLSGRPNNLMVSTDSRKVYVGIAQAPGAVDVIDAVALTPMKSIPVDGPVHNVYVTPDGRFAVSGSVATSVISVIDTTTDSLAWTLKLDAGIRPMIFDTNPDGSTRHMFVQLSNYHGVVVVDFATRKEITRFELPDVPGEKKELEGLQGAPAHGLAVTPDQKTLLATSKWYGAMYAYSIPDFKHLGTVLVGSHPEWLTLTPDGKTAYVAAAGDDQTTVVDLKTLRVTARIPVGFVPKRNGTLLMAASGGTR